MFQFSPLPIIVHDMNMNIIDVNNKAVEEFGYSKEEFLKMTVFNLHDENEFEHSAQVLDEMKQKKKLSVETSFKRKNGTIFFAEATPCKYILNEKPFIHVYIQDITQRKKDEMNLLNAIQKAEQSDRLKSAFLANMSHEIRTPMNGILGFSELLKEPGLTGDQQQEYIGIIKKSGARMLNIINDIVDISKIESGLMEVDLKESNINEQIDFIHTFFKPEMDRKRIQFFSKKSLPLKEAAINTDREKIYAILTNLVKNAIK